MPRGEGRIVQRMKKTVNVFSPAKVNLHLAIGERRDDGYHDARSVMQALTLHDTVTVVVDDGIDEFLNPEGFSDFAVDVVCDVREGVAPLTIPAERNIAYKAAMLLAERLDCARGVHVFIRIEKHIPHEAGLGGGSSNAAAALVGLCHVWGVSPLAPEVMEVASSLGADVPFFLHGGCAVLGGRGDVLERTIEPRRGTIVLVRPDAGVSTAAAYAAFDGAEALQGDAAVRARRAEGQADKATSANDLTLYNNLAAASESVLPELARVRAWLAEQPGVVRDAATGEPCVLLSGSGSATFALVGEVPANDAVGAAAKDAPSVAAAIVAAARLEGWWARSCSFTSVGARVIEAPSFGGFAAPATNLGAVHKSW